MPIEAPEGYVAELVRIEDSPFHIWQLWVKPEENDKWVYVDEFKAQPVGLEIMVSLAERALVHTTLGAVSLCSRVPGWKVRDWEFVHEVEDYDKYVECEDEDYDDDEED